MTPNSYFDEIFCINLHRSTDRWIKVRERFIREDLYVTRFEGVDKLDSLVQLQFNEHIQKPAVGIKTLGRYAIWRTFTKLFNYVLDNPQIKSFLIFEDDILFHREFKNKFDIAVNNLPMNWDMWYLGATQTQWKNVEFKPTDLFYKSTDSTFGMFGVAIKTEFLKKIIHQYRLGLKNNDHFFATDIDKTNVYVSNPFLIGHDYGYSINADYTINDDIADKRTYFKYDKTIYI